MESILEIFIHWALGLLGATFFILKHVWTKIKSEGFNPRKFFLENKTFWAVGVILHLVISTMIKVEPKTASLIEGIGIAVEHSKSGFIFLGYFLASGTNKAIKKGVMDSK